VQNVLEEISITLREEGSIVIDRANTWNRDDADGATNLSPGLFLHPMKRLYELTKHTLECRKAFVVKSSLSRERQMDGT
jgi:hypothetical protein